MYGVGACRGPGRRGAGQLCWSCYSWWAARQANTAKTDCSRGALTNCEAGGTEPEKRREGQTQKGADPAHSWPWLGAPTLTMTGEDWWTAAPLTLGGGQCLQCKQGGPTPAPLAFLEPVSPSTSLRSHYSLCLSIQWARYLGSAILGGQFWGVRFHGCHPGWACGLAPGELGTVRANVRADN